VTNIVLRPAGPTSGSAAEADRGDIVPLLFSSPSANKNPAATTRKSLPVVAAFVTANSMRLRRRPTRPFVFSRNFSSGLLGPSKKFARPRARATYLKLNDIRTIVLAIVRNSVPLFLTRRREV